MAYYIKKPSIIDSSITVYYSGNSRWTDDFSQKSLYASEEAAQNLMVNNDGKNGGWSNAIVVSE